MFDLNALYFPFPMICGIWLMITLSKRQKQGRLFSQVNGDGEVKLMEMEKLS